MNKILHCYSKLMLSKVTTGSQTPTCKMNFFIIIHLFSTAALGLHNLNSNLKKRNRPLEIMSNQGIS